MEGLWFLQRLKEWSDGEAIVWRDRSFSYRWLCQAVNDWRGYTAEVGVVAGQVVALGGDYSPRVCALLLALIENGNIIVPLASAIATQKEEFLDIAQVEIIFDFNPEDAWAVTSRAVQVNHPLLKRLQESGTPGLVLFSSGSTAKSKAVLHSFDRLLEKFKVRRRCMRTLTFLLFDHVGGINTLLYTLANGGTVVSIEDRTPAAVCRAIETHRIQMLPTSPTFLNLLLLSEAYKDFDLSSLELITYGTEPMPATTLQRLNAIFPDADVLQTYGLSELGILRSKSKDSSSLWVKIGGEGFETKVVDNVLWIRSRSAMLGYLNAPSPFDQDGWFNTQDVVEVDGEYLRILGRETDIINVGGEKVYPAEVESVLLQMDNVRDVTVCGESNPIMGQIVVARFDVVEPESIESLKRRVREHCKDSLARYKIPARVEIANGPQFGGRFKKNRKA